MNAHQSAAQAYAFGDDEAHDAVDIVRDDSVFSVGAYLARQRRLRGVSLDELEATTRIPRRSLARLEAGAFDRQQDAFVRGFVRTVAGAIGVDPSDTLVRMVEADPVRAVCRRRLPWKAAGSGFAAALFLTACAALLYGLPGQARAPEGPARTSLPEPTVTIRRDPVRLLAERVREATPGSFARPRLLAPPPSMFLAPVAELALDEIFLPTGAAREVLSAVSAGPE